MSNTVDTTKSTVPTLAWHGPLHSMHHGGGLTVVQAARPPTAAGPSRDRLSILAIQAREAPEPIAADAAAGKTDSFVIWRSTL